MIMQQIDMWFSATDMQRSARQSHTIHIQHVAATAATKFTFI